MKEIGSQREKTLSFYNSLPSGEKAVLMGEKVVLTGGLSSFDKRKSSFDMGEKKQF